jgi:antitoxin component of MazEF toxin-antitoxin module
MRARVWGWRNNLAIRLPKAVVASLQVREGEPVDLVIEGDSPDDSGRAAALHA